MTGLEKIKAKIEEQSRENCERIYAETNLKIKKMIAEAREEGNRRACEIVGAAQREADKKNAVSKSTAESITRNRYLEIRNAILNDIISAAYLSIDKFTDEEYFDMIFSLCKKNIQPGECTMYMNGYDLSRLPESFESRINESLYETASVTLSKKAADIENGFILDYGSITVNCTLKSVFDENMEELKDMLSKELFS
ncbi:MAG: V-type ATP synthase subunit E [Clostridia bacterium]|nr:V-type ATP synthase subunit E [Clostridia bacterium]